MRQVRIYKSLKRMDMYLYVDVEQVLEDLPDGLMQAFGRAQEVMDLELTVDRKLARADATEVLSQIETRGFYLQMPPEDIVSAESRAASVSAAKKKPAKYTAPDSDD
jgi:uncharacterized protein YcgL (UPF0745 family)